MCRRVLNYTPRQTLFTKNSHPRSVEFALRNPLHPWGAPPPPFRAILRFQGGLTAALHGHQAASSCFNPPSHKARDPDVASSPSLVLYFEFDFIRNGSSDDSGKAWLGNSTCYVLY